MRETVTEGSPSVELIPVGRGIRREAILASFTVVALGVALLKPWAAPAKAPLPTPVPSVLITASPSPQADVRPPLPATVFAPPFEACFDNARWRVCVLGSAGGQIVRSMFSPDRAPATGAAAPRTSSAPAVLIVTTAGAGLAFYPPVESDDVVSGTIAVSAWRVGGEAVGTRWLALRTVGPMGAGARVAGNVHVPETDALMAAEEWPAGTYIVRFQAANGDHWERFFALTVRPIPGA